VVKRKKLKRLLLPREIGIKRSNTDHNVSLYHLLQIHTLSLISLRRKLSDHRQKKKMVADANGSSSSSFNFLIYGKTGWIGGLLGKLCEAQGITYTYGSGRLQDRQSIVADIESVKPSHVFNAAGVTGRPNVDWCESHKVETIRTNVAGTLTLADICREKGLVLINYATGCIFEYDSGHPLGSGIGFKEEDTPNFTGSFYSKTKAMVSNFLHFQSFYL